MFPYGRVNYSHHTAEVSGQGHTPKHTKSINNKWLARVSTGVDYNPPKWASILQLQMDRAIALKRQAPSLPLR